ncbi:DUF3841 domain-containing protein [Sedimentibacter saalensis]|uniref:DUF3841 domain-containing protein n=1 Tax=Sedimentibacter saalensis TaxID=130788 RepID=UPI0028A06FE0|nr:DUF3841 domain-containing protein [Sedimentibacter saalensis]
MENIIKDSGKVTLWTRQDIRSLQELEKNGVVRITRENLVEKFDLISDHIIYLYKWFVEAAQKIVPKPEDVEFPVWCSISEEYMLRPTIDQVVYVLEVDRSEIIYFDGLKWDYVLNHHYVPKDENDEKEYARDIESKGYKNSFSFVDEKTAHFYPEERKRVMDSWMRVFETDVLDKFRIQANIWEIRSDMVKEILKV